MESGGVFGKTSLAIIASSDLTDEPVTGLFPKICFSGRVVESSIVLFFQGWLIALVMFGAPTPHDDDVQMQFGPTMEHFWEVHGGRTVRPGTFPSWNNNLFLVPNLQRSFVGRQWFG